MIMDKTKLGDIFDISYGTSLALNKCTISNRGLPFVSRTEKNNGVRARIRPIIDIDPIPKHTLSVAVSGSVLSAFYQPEDYYTGYHVLILYPKTKMSQNEMLGYSIIIKSNCYKYSYGRQANRTLSDILVPRREWVSNLFGNTKLVAKPKPDKFDESYPEPLQFPELWGEFKFSDLFKIKKGRSINKIERSAGKTPYISSSKYNNGCTEYIDENPLFPKNTITVNSNGSIGEAFYQPIPYIASSDVNILFPKFHLNEFIGMFLVTVIRQERYRFNYGRKWNLSKIESASFKLPMQYDKTPDWNFMEKYIKSLPYTSNLKL